jgi:hypothetical protein
MVSTEKHIAFLNRLAYIYNLLDIKETKHTYQALKKKQVCLIQRTKNYLMKTEGGKK